MKKPVLCAAATMVSQYWLIYCFIVVLSVQKAYALTEDQQRNIANQQNQIIQNQQQFEREKVRQNNLEQIRKEQQKIELEREFNLEENDGKIVHDLSSIQCFRIHKIVFSDNHILSKWLEAVVRYKYVGQCLTLDQIAEISREISNDLVEKGFVTSRVEIPAQNLLKGVLEIHIIESYLEKIVLNEDSFFDKTQKLTAFGLMGSQEHEVLNLHDIEKGIEQMNTLRSNNASVKLMPGAIKGSSIVKIENAPKGRFRANIFYDNNGAKVTGSKRGTVSVSQDNILHLNDNLSLSRTSNDADRNRDKGRSTSFNGSFSMPFKQHNITIKYLKSSYFFIAGEGDGLLRVYGDTSTKSVSLDSVLFSNKKMKINSHVNLNSRYNQNFSNDEKQYVSSRKASILDVSLSSVLYLDKASLFLKPSYSRSVNILDAQKDLPNIPVHAAHSEFNMFKFYANYSQSLQVPYLEMPMHYNFSVDSQISQQTLNGNDRFSVGGFYSVRGFKEGSIASDSGYNIKNEISFNLGQAILPYVNMEKAHKSVSYLHYFSLTPFYDYGFVRSKGGGESGRISGGGVKTAFNYKNISASLTFSYAISKSKMLLQHYGENSAIYFDIASDFSFF